METNAVPTTVTLYSAERDIVVHLSDRFGLSFSAAVRMIINDWNSKHNRVLVDTKVDYDVEPVNV